MKRPFLVCACSLAFLHGAAFAPASEVEWNQEFIFIGLPQELDASWMRMGDGEADLEDGRLVLRSRTEGGSYYLLSGASGIWNADEPTTVEFRVRVAEVEADAEAGGHIILQTNENAWVFNLENSDFKTYRITLEYDQALVYELDSAADPIVLETERLDRENYTEDELNANSIGFGDYSKRIGGVTEWEFLRWTNQGAFPPEP